MPVIDLGTPSEKQKLFLEAKCRYVAFGGARGGGKSHAVRMKAVLMASAHAGIRELIVRRTFPELHNNYEIFLTPMLKGVAKYNNTNKEYLFNNGSVIKLDYCNSDGDLDHYQGVQYDIIFIDEATQLPESHLQKINACLRGANNFPKRVFYTCNPGGKSHAYIKRLFVDRKFNKGENPDNYEFIQSFVQDNKALLEAQPDYIEQLETLPPKLREAWLYGKWDVFEGQVFEEFCDDPDGYGTRLNTHVIKPFRVPDDWKILRGFDFGFSKPFSVGWYAVDHSNRIYRIQELYGCTQTPNEGLKLNPYEIAKRIREVEEADPNLKGKSIRGIADPAIFEESKGESIARMMERQFVYFEPADHARIAGKMQCHYRLHFDQNGVPMFYVFNNCKEFIRTIPLLLYDEKKVEDIDTDMEDHIYDEWRYVMMEYPLNPKYYSPKTKYIGTDGKNDPLNMMEGQRYDTYEFYRSM